MTTFNSRDLAASTDRAATSPASAPVQTRATTPADGSDARRKQYRDADGLRVPYTEVILDNSPGTGAANAPVELYDTSGPGSDPEVGLPPLRAEWIA